MICILLINPLTDKLFFYREKCFTARNGGPTRREDCFLSPFVQRRREMAHPAPTKSFSRPSPEAAMLPMLSAETHPPPSVPPSLLVQSLSPKGIAGSDITDESLMPSVDGFIG